MKWLRWLKKIFKHPCYHTHVIFLEFEERPATIVVEGKTYLGKESRFYEFCTNCESARWTSWKFSRSW